MTDVSRWLPFRTGPAGKVALLCLPHAGAGASTYRTWAAGLPAEIAACPVQLPGRESRAFEQPYQRIEPMVTDLARDLGDVTRWPYALFGHSMGAVVAFELVREIRRRGGPLPIQLFVAGRQAPHLPNVKPELRGLAGDRLASELRALGGTPDEVLADPALLDSITPLLRADFSVNETYQYNDEPPLDVPITAFAATQDPRASIDEVNAWRYETTGAFRSYVLPGEHFAVLRHGGFVRARIADALAFCLAG